MFRLALVLSVPSLLAAQSVDFSYAFATPHRITIARPSASEKTLLDLEPGTLTEAWTYEDLRNQPLAIFKTPRTQWRVRLKPLVDAQPFSASTWTRGERYLPMLDNRYERQGVNVRLEAIGGQSAALVRVVASNAGAVPHNLAVECEVVGGGWVAHNPAWMDPGRDPDALVATQGDRADRVLMLAVGAASYPTDRMKMTLAWNLAPGETRSGWIVRPYKAYQEELPKLRLHNWAGEFAAGVAEWKALLQRSARVEIPEDGALNGFYAGLADLFIMREPIANGYVGVTPGTEVYRAVNPFEPAIAALAMDQLGYHAEAADGLRVHIDMQAADGNWADPTGWAHHMWGTSGMKAWAAMEHYRLTGDRAYLEALYPHLLRCSRWQEKQRQRTRILADNARPPEYGLMPRGMGDGGLMHGKDYFGVFYTHNILAVYADKLALEAAEILGKRENTAELREIYQRGCADLLASLDAGAIEESGYRWIPGSAGDASGSRWGVLYALFPTELLEPRHALIDGTVRKMQQALSPGGQPINTGWMADGAWVAATLDNLAEALLRRGEADRATGYLYSTLNHATPLYSWCEERGQEAGTKKISGDRQHLWTPLAVVRYTRDALVYEQGETLHLAAGTARTWLEPGKSVAIRGASTHFGDVSYRITPDSGRGVLRAEIEPPTRRPASRIVLHLRHPQHAALKRVLVNGKPWSDFDAQAETVSLPVTGPIKVEAIY